MHAGMGVEASNGYKALQSLESKILLNQLLTETDPKIMHRITVGESEARVIARYLKPSVPFLERDRFAVSIVFCVAYGRRVESLDDPAVIANFKTDECGYSLILL